VRRAEANRREATESTPEGEEEEEEEEEQEDFQLSPGTNAEISSAIPAEPPYQPSSGVAHQAPYDWITLIDEEYLSGESSAGSILANSSALDVLPGDRASDDIPLEGAVSLPSTALGHLAGISPHSLEGWTVGERHLLNHFLQSVSRSLVVVKDDENPFIGIIVPMALENDAVRHALTALSACHLARIYPDFKRNVLRHRSHALGYLKGELGPNTATLSALAATLLLCLLEVRASAVLCLPSLFLRHLLRYAKEAPEDGYSISRVPERSCLTWTCQLPTSHFIFWLTCMTICAAWAALLNQPCHILCPRALESWMLDPRACIHYSDSGQICTTA
jgi:hypothetical protein